MKEFHDKYIKKFIIDLIDGDSNDSIEYRVESAISTRCNNLLESSDININDQPNAENKLKNLVFLEMNLRYISIVDVDSIRCLEKLISNISLKINKDNQNQSNKSLAKFRHDALTKIDSNMDLQSPFHREIDFQIKEIESIFAESNKLVDKKSILQEKHNKDLNKKEEAQKTLKAQCGFLNKMARDYVYGIETESDGIIEQHKDEDNFYKIFPQEFFVYNEYRPQLKDSAKNEVFVYILAEIFNNSIKNRNTWTNIQSGKISRYIRDQINDNTDTLGINAAVGDASKEIGFSYEKSVFNIPPLEQIHTYSLHL